ncbi:hypothetical protein M1M93_01780, partial [Thermodesulfovibrionales bacterium]|nr:hypothetical protein [Thermodesulfovibrionales bacterium]
GIVDGLKKYEPEKIILFGSVGREGCREGSSGKIEMKKRIILLCALILISLLLGGCQHQVAEPPVQKDITIPEKRETLEELRYMPGEVLVRFKEEATDEEKTVVIEELGLEIIERVLLTDIYRLKLPAGATVSAAVEKLKQHAKVKHAQPNYIYRIGIQEIQEKVEEKVK